jgi:shikimate 5-dehydrogenase
MKRGEDGLVLAQSTDAVVFGEIFEDRGFKDLSSVLVLGAGGSAATALAAAKGRDAYLSARNARRAQALADTFDSVSVIPWGASVAGAVVVNATPLGMSGERLPGGIVELGGALVDLPYSDTATGATSKAIGNGIPAVDGIEFLARQAALSFRWWTGESVDFAVLAEIARNV